MPFVARLSPGALAGGRLCGFVFLDQDIEHSLGMNGEGFQIKEGAAVLGLHLELRPSSTSETRDSLPTFLL